MPEAIRVIERNGPSEEDALQYVSGSTFNIKMEEGEAQITLYVY